MQGTYERLLRLLAKLSLLVVDDFGLANLTEIVRQDLLEAVEERYGRGATLVTARLPVGDWHAYPGDGRIADAILYRLVHNAHRIELSSKESLRKDRTAAHHGGQSERNSTSLRRFAPMLSAITGSVVRHRRNAHGRS